MTVFLIDRCRCSGLSFAELLELARCEHLDLPAVQARTGAGRLCKHCRPWLQRVLDSGTCAFEEDSDTLRNGAVLFCHFTGRRDTPEA